jgi:hypothetical protein
MRPSVFRIKLADIGEGNAAACARSCAESNRETSDLRFHVRKNCNCPLSDDIQESQLNVDKEVDRTQGDRLPDAERGNMVDPQRK